MPEAERTTAARAPVLICDLDGTILRGNSFPLWILYLMGGRLPEFGLRSRLVLSLQVQKLLLQRRLGGIEHERLMRGVQQAWHIAGDGSAYGAADRIATMLRNRVRPAFEPLLQQITAGEFDAVLATAAAAEYAEPLALQLGFRHALTTPGRLPPDGRLNQGAEKLRRVQDFLAGRQWQDRARVLLTDHVDDMPLVRHCHAAGWFGSAEMLARSRAETQGVRIVDCRALNAAALLSAIGALSEHALSAVAAAPALADSTLA